MNKIICSIIGLLLYDTCFACDENPIKLEWEYAQYQNYYYNCVFGYSIRIPEGLIAESGTTPEQPVQEHGVFILLSKNPQEYIFTDGEYNSIEWESVSAMTKSHADWIRERASSIVKIEQYNIDLNGLSGKRLIVKYRCNDRLMIEDYFLLLHKKRNICYELVLISEFRHYSNRKKVFEKIANTWKLEPIC